MRKAAKTLATRPLRRFTAETPTKPSLIEIFINDQPHLVDPKMTVFQACFHAGVIIPRFCYHERLSIAGNCRMCLVEVEKAPKPVASCSAQVAPGMRVRTDSEKTRLHRGAVMEFLLANHPLDCPVCDQGGECDLQDISREYGYGTGRYHEYKRAVDDKNFGPLISTAMNRCIHCTRCVRFAEEVAGVTDLGTMGRGRDTEISTYVQKMLDSELSGNIADLCPVGALNHGPLTFRVRIWDLQTTHSVDLMEGIVAPVEQYWRGPEIMRTLPKVHEGVNEEWISDKSRYAFDGLKRQRLTFPMLLDRTRGEFAEVEWAVAVRTLAQRLHALEPQNQLVGLTGQFTSLEAATAIRDLFAALGCPHLLWACHPFSGGQRSDFLLNRLIPEFEELDVLVLVGCNPKHESPVLNARILRAARRGLKVYKIGSYEELGYEFVHLGTSTRTLEGVLRPEHPLGAVLRAAKNSHVMFSSELANSLPDLQRHFHAFQAFAAQLQAETGSRTTVGVLHNFVGPISGYEVGIDYRDVRELPSQLKMLINFGNDNPKLLEEAQKRLAPDAFVVYVGTNGDLGAVKADLVLPIAAFTEHSATYVSTEGRTQLALKVVNPPFLAREEWGVLRALSEELGNPLKYDSVEELRYRIAELAPHTLKYDYVERFSQFPRSAPPAPTSSSPPMLIGAAVENYYKTDAISRSSVVMAKCAAAFNPSKATNFARKLYK